MISYNEFINEMQGKCTNHNYIKYIDDFLRRGMKLGLITKSNWNNVIEKMRKIDTFTDLPVQKRGLYGETAPTQDNSGLIVSINPNLPPYKREQYAFHELTHVIMDGNIEYIEKNIRETMQGDISTRDVNRIKNGYIAIEEAVAQEVSEEMIYSLQNRTRIPLKDSASRDVALPGVKFYSNYDFYGLYQQVGITFAKTLRGIGNQTQRGDNGQNIYLHSLCKRGFNGNFAKDIVDEYTNDGHYVELMTSLKKLGGVFDVKQATFGVNNGVNLTEQNLQASSTSYLEVINQFRELEDLRPKRESFEI